MGELLQPMHLLVIVVVALFLFGPKKLPELGKGLGDGIRNFKDSMRQASETKPPVETPAPQDSNTHDHVA
jgi:sec-independent protein translocase protein TatA